MVIVEFKKEFRAKARSAMEAYELTKTALLKDSLIVDHYPSVDMSDPEFEKALRQTPNPPPLTTGVITRLEQASKHPKSHDILRIGL